MGKEQAAPGKLPELMRRLSELQQQVEAVKAQEKEEVLERMREAIAVYDITAEELFPKRTYKPRAATSGAAGRAKANAGKKAKAPRLKKKRVRRTFDEAQRKELLAQHTKLVSGGLAFDAAAKKVGIVHSLLRKWYTDMGVPVPERKAA